MNDGEATEACRKARGNDGGDGKEASFYHVGKAQQAFETVWTEANYDALTEGLMKLPVTWRFYAKHRVFSMIDKLPSDDPGRSDGTAVRHGFTRLSEEFPDLAEAGDNS